MRQVVYVTLPSEPTNRAHLFNRAVNQTLFTEMSIYAGFHASESGSLKIALVGKNGVSYSLLSFIPSLFETFGAKVEIKPQHFLAALLTLESCESPEKVIEHVKNWNIFEPHSVLKLNPKDKMFTLNPLASLTVEPV